MRSTIRQRRILKHGSPSYQLSMATLAAAAVYANMLTGINPDMRKYLPLDWIEITNMATVNVSLQLDDGDIFVIPSGVIKTIEDKPYRRIRVVNLDAAAATGDDNVIIQMQRQPITQDTYLRRFKIR